MLTTVNQIIEIQNSFTNISAQASFNDLVNTILKSDKGTPGNNPYLSRLLLWQDRKNPTKNKHHESYQEAEDDSDVESFIKKYCDPDEVAQVS